MNISMITFKSQHRNMTGHCLNFVSNIYFSKNIADYMEDAKYLVYNGKTSYHHLEDVTYTIIGWMSQKICVKYE